MNVANNEWEKWGSKVWPHCQHYILSRKRKKKKRVFFHKKIRAQQFVVFKQESFVDYFLLVRFVFSVKDSILYNEIREFNFTFSAIQWHTQISCSSDSRMQLYFLNEIPSNDLNWFKVRKKRHLFRSLTQIPVSNSSFIRNTI